MNIRKIEFSVKLPRCLEIVLKNQGKTMCLLLPLSARFILWNKLRPFRNKLSLLCSFPVSAATFDLPIK